LNPLKFCGNNLIERYAHKMRVNRTINDILLGKKLSDILLDFLRIINRIIGKIKMKNGAVRFL